MQREDARNLPAAAQEEKRKQAVRMRKQGYTYKAIGEFEGSMNADILIDFMISMLPDMV